MLTSAASAVGLAAGYAFERRGITRAPAGVLVAMSALAAPLTLAEQIDAMLMGWLERVAGQRRPRSRRPAGHRGAHVADTALPDIEAVCANWAMTVERPARGRRR